MYLFPNKKAKIPILPALASYIFLVGCALAITFWLDGGEAILFLMASFALGLIPSFVVYPLIRHFFRSTLSGLSPIVEQGLVFLGFVLVGFLISIDSLREQGIGIFDRGFATLVIIFIALPLELGWMVFLFICWLTTRKVSDETGRSAQGNH